MYEVAIIGNDHINTLGVIREFGEKNIMPLVFLVTDSKKNAVIKSKYVKRAYICNCEDKAYEEILKFAKDNAGKNIILIPTSDASAELLDSHLYSLPANVISPNINKTKGEMATYMNKEVQHKVAAGTKLKTIRGQLYKLNGEDSLRISFPVILKPNISSKGSKNDIRICESEAAFRDAIEKLKTLGYREILVQEFIDYDYECDVQGLSYDGVAYVPGVIMKERIYPAKRGSTTYGRVVPNGHFKDAIGGIYQIMKKINYSGIFDVEVFIRGEEVYLNEINFRNSAVSYAYGESNIPYHWYLSCINKKLVRPAAITEEYYIQDDQADLHKILDGEIKISEYIKSRKKARILLAANECDRIPSRALLIKKIANKIKGE